MKVKKLRGAEQAALQSMVLPGLIFLILFSYIPMWGILIAFKNYNIVLGFIASKWVGLDNFKEFVTSRDFGLIMKNTITISVLKLLICFPAPILLALTLNEVRQPLFKKAVQTITYMPYFLSWVIVSNMIFSLLSVDNGSVNILLVKLGILQEPISWLSNKNYFVPILIISRVWKEMGYSSIIYLAAMSGINPEYYEAAEIDGAGRLKQALVITLPSIAPQIIILLILAISNILNAGFEDIYLLTNSMKNGVLIPVANVIDTHVYQMGVLTQRFSYATAVGLFKSVINLGLLIIANSFSKKITGSSLW